MDSADRIESTRLPQVTARVPTPIPAACASRHPVRRYVADLEVVRGIADELAAAERELLINVTYQDAARERGRMEFLAQGLVDGVQHLIDLGHRRIAYIRGEDDLESTHQRYRAYADGLQLAGIAVDERLVASCDFSYNGGFRTAARLIADHGPTAVVAGADLIAFGAIDAARAHGLDVPSQCSVIGFDDLPQAAQSFPGLTTVRQPLHDMGQIAARALLSLVDGQPLLMDHMQLPTTLMVRGSTAVPAE